MSERSCFRRPINKQNWKRPEALLKPASQHLYEIHWSLRSQLSWEKSPLLTCRTLGLLVKKLAADDNYPVLNRDNLTIPIQMQLSQKKKTFSKFFAAFLKSRLNIKDFEICITAPLSYLLVTGKEIVFEKVSLIDMPNLGTAC